MKLKSLLLSIVVVGLLSTQASAQQVEREMVVYEIATGTWCMYCPAAANGADEMIENGHNAAFIEYHGGDDYENTAGSYRISSYYGIGSYPTTKIDGVYEQSGGGGSSSSNYSSYLNYYNQRIDVLSSFSFDVVGSHSGLTDFEIEITVNKVADSDDSNLKLHAVVTESHIDEYWQGMDELNFVERGMYPNQYGTDIDFTDVSSVTETITFSIDDEWDVDHCELVIFLQNNSSKEILQGKKLELTQLPGANATDMSLSDLRNIPASNCDGSISPVIEAINYGSDEITSFTVEYDVNGSAYTHDWTGSLASMESVVIDLPEATFDVEASNTINVEITNPNGIDDEYLGNNTQSSTFEEAIATTTLLELLLRTDNNPEETSWEIVNAAGEVVVSGGPYTQANAWVEMYTEFSLPANDCYAFIIYDEAGNGFDDGNGMAKLTSDDGVEIVNINTVDFGYSNESQFTATSGVGVNDFARLSDLEVYPNPANSYFDIDLTLAKNANVVISLFDTFGKKVIELDKGMMTEGYNKETITTDNLVSGLYLIRIMIDNQELQSKVVVK